MVSPAAPAGGQALQERRGTVEPEGPGNEHGRELDDRPVVMFNGQVELGAGDLGGRRWLWPGQ